MTNTVQLIVYESAGVGGTIGESHLATTSPLIVCPLALIDVTVRIVADAMPLPLMIAVVTLIITSILEKHLNSTSRYHPLFKPALNELIAATEENASAMWLVLTPFTFVERPSAELACPSSVSLAVLEGTFVNITVAHAHLTWSLPQILRHVTYVLVNRLLFDWL